MRSPSAASIESQLQRSSTETSHSPNRDKIERLRKGYSGFKMQPLIPAPFSPSTGRRGEADQ